MQLTVEKIATNYFLQYLRFLCVGSPSFLVISEPSKNVLSVDVIVLFVCCDQPKFLMLFCGVRLKVSCQSVDDFCCVQSKVSCRSLDALFCLLKNYLELLEVLVTIKDYRFELGSK